MTVEKAETSGGIEDASLPGNAIVLIHIYSWYHNYKKLRDHKEDEEAFGQTILCPLSCSSFALRGNFTKNDADF
jgi:hypothetical protein